MNVKLNTYTISYDRPRIGMRVCPANGATKVGIVTGIDSNSNYGWEGKKITVLWTTGKTAGSTTETRGRNLVDYDVYTARIAAEAARLEAMTVESQKFGM